MIKLLAKWPDLHMPNYTSVHQYQEWLVNPCFIVHVKYNKEDSGVQIGINAGGTYHVLQTPYALEAIQEKLEELNVRVVSL